QALTLMNDVVFVECAQALARRILNEPMNNVVAEDGTGGADSATVEQATVDARLRYAFQLSLSRVPLATELDRLRDLYSSALSVFDRDEAAAKKLLGDQQPEKVSPAEAAAWTIVARTVLNLDEFITRE